jgi:predicted aspartyl protease
MRGIDRRIAIGVVLTLGCQPIAGLAEQPHYQPAGMELPAGGAQAPLKLMDRLPLVEVRINGRGPFLLVLDTGASLTALDRRVATQLGLDPHKSVTVSGATLGGVQTAEVVELGTLDLGGGRFSGVEAVVVDLGFVVEGHRSVDGLLGFGVFEGCLLTLDYPAGTVTLEPGELPNRADDDVIPFLKAQGVPRVRLPLAGRSVTVTVDSGANGCLTLPRSLRKRVPFQAPPVAMGRIQRATEDPEATLARLDGTLKIGPHSVKDPLVRLAGRAGVMGSQILQHFVVTFDQKHSRVRFARDSEEPVTVPPVMSRGLYTELRGGEPVVADVVPGTEADKAGVQVGDRVIRVNGYEIRELSQPTWRRLWNQDAPLRLTFRRGETTFEATVPLIELVP